MGVVIVEGKGAVLELNLRRPIVTNWAFATRLFPNYFEVWAGLVVVVVAAVVCFVTKT